MRLRYAPKALEELEAILAYIEERTPQGARRVGLTVKAVERLLEAFPRIGMKVESRRPNLRRYVLNPFPYVMFYELMSDEIVVVGLRHGRRDPLA